MPINCCLKLLYLHSNLYLVELMFLIYFNVFSGSHLSYLFSLAYSLVGVQWKFYLRWPVMYETFENPVFFIEAGVLEEPSVLVRE